MTGVERYTIEIIKALGRQDKERRYVLYTPRNLAESFLNRLPSNFEEKVIPMPRLWTQSRLAAEMAIKPPNLLFVPGHAMPWKHPKKTVVTIHDVGFERYKANYSAFALWYLRFSTDYALRHAAKIITPSEETKKEIGRLYPKSDASRIEAIHSGFTPMREDSRQTKVPSPFLLVTGRLEERKNIFRILDAFEMVKTRFPSLKLAFAGGPGVGAEHFYRKVENSQFKKDIHLLNNVKDEELVALYKKAEALLFPSLYEGFGLPILEAFNYDLPVITSNVTATAEVAGDAALLVNPHKTSDIARGISSILTDKPLAEKLRIKGKRRLAEFGWNKAASRIIGIFQELLA